MEFTKEIDEYFVLKMNLVNYIPTNRSLEEDFYFSGDKLSKKHRKAEKRLLKSYFKNWASPYYGKLQGWRENSPIYIMHRKRLICGIYLCDQNEFGERSDWGQLHYAFMEPRFKGKGLYSILFNEAVRRARAWGLKGLILNSDRHMLPDLYIKWGAVPWKRIRKENTPSTPLALNKKVYNSIRSIFKVIK